MNIPEWTYDDTFCTKCKGKIDNKVIWDNEKSFCSASCADMFFGITNGRYIVVNKKDDGKIYLTMSEEYYNEREVGNVE